MLLRQTMLYLPAQIIGPLAQVVAAIVWTHWLLPGPYGLLTFLIASQDLVFLLCLSWWTQFTLRYLGGLDGEESLSFARSEASIFGLTFCLQILVTLLLLAFVREPISAELALAAIACVSTRSLLTHLGERARAHSQIGVYTLGQLAGSVFGFALAYAGVAFVAATPAVVLWGYALAQLCGIALMWGRLGIIRGDFLPRRVILSAALAYGAPLLVAGGFAWIAMNGIRLVIDKAAGAEALGLVAVAWSLGLRLAATLAMLVTTASFPLAVKYWSADARGEAYRQLAYGGVLLIGLIVPASVGLCLLAEPFVTFFVAAPFRETTIAVLPYAAAAGALRNIRMHVTDAVFLLIERPKVNTIINLVDAIAAVIGCWVGFILGGLVGAVAGCLVGTIVSVFLSVALAHWLASFAFPWVDLAKIAGASALMAFVLAAVPWESLPMPLVGRMIVEAIVGACFYALAIANLYPAVATQLARRLLAPV